MLALALVVTNLHNLNSSYEPVGKPESARAAEVLSRAFPPGSSYVVSGDQGDVVIVHSSRWTAGEPRIQGLCRRTRPCVRGDRGCE